jgi:hypothetical protein
LISIGVIAATEDEIERLDTVMHYMNGSRVSIHSHRCKNEIGI